MLFNNRKMFTLPWLVINFLRSYYIQNLMCLCRYIHIYSRTHMCAQSLSPVAGSRSTEKKECAHQNNCNFSTRSQCFLCKKLGLEKHEVFLPDSIHFQQEQSAPLSWTFYSKNGWNWGTSSCLEIVIVFNENACLPFGANTSTMIPLGQSISWTKIYNARGQDVMLPGKRRRSSFFFPAFSFSLLFCWFHLWFPKRYRIIKRARAKNHLVVTGDMPNHCMFENKAGGKGTVR